MFGGDAEKSTIEAIGDEALNQLYFFFETHIRSLTYINKIFEKEKKRRNQPIEDLEKEINDAKEIFESLSDSGNGMNERMKLYRKFCQTVEKNIRNIAFEVYPEIADLEADKILEFETIFVRDIQSMHEKLENLLSEL